MAARQFRYAWILPLPLRAVHQDKTWIGHIDPGMLRFLCRRSFFLLCVFCFCLFSISTPPSANSRPGPIQNNRHASHGCLARLNGGPKGLHSIRCASGQAHTCNSYSVRSTSYIHTYISMRRRVPATRTNMIVMYIRAYYVCIYIYYVNVCVFLVSFYLLLLGFVMPHARRCYRFGKSPPALSLLPCPAAP